MVKVDDHSRAALHEAAADWKPLDREIEAFWGARVWVTTGDHVYKKLVTDNDVYNLCSRHKEEYLIDIQYEMTGPEGDSEAFESPDQTGLRETAK